MTVLGIDIGGSGIKGAPVDIAVGALTEERFRLETPRPASPDAVLPVLADVAAHWPGTDPVGVTFPGVVRGGVVGTAANLHPDWVGLNANLLFTERLGRAVTVLNDADAAGVAEMAFGAGRNVRGVVLLLTFGTGIGSALFLDGRLVPNTELGHLELNGADAELHASDRIREEADLGWPDWAARVQDYLRVVERLLSPDLVIVGGGVSKKADRFLPYVKVGMPVVPAVLQNNAGIVGAAMATTGRY
jgi:polyphosphate glucokinase